MTRILILDVFETQIISDVENIHIQCSGKLFYIKFIERSINTLTMFEANHLTYFCFLLTKLVIQHSLKARNLTVSVINY